MKLHINLLHNIHNKLKQPYNDLNLELSGSLNFKEDYYIDSYLKYYLTKINKYKIKGNIIFNYSEVRIMKYLIRRSFNIYFYDNRYIRWMPINYNLKRLQNKTNIHAHNDYAFRWASENGHFKVVKLLLQNGTNVHADSDYALRRASKNGHFKIVKLLLQNNANINDDDLIQASNNRHFKVIKVLLQHGANVHARDDCALRWASITNHLKVVKLLLQHGANVHAQNNEAIRRAYYKCHFNIVKLLSQNVHAQNDMDLIWTSRLEAVKLFLQHCANVRSQNKETLR